MLFGSPRPSPRRYWYRSSSDSPLPALSYPPFWHRSTITTLELKRRSLVYLETRDGLVGHRKAQGKSVTARTENTDQSATFVSSAWTL
ncbi:hypothetical protein WG66_002606 [Moniliophthora roreri]|nr:hypothetical protein WG66_002606 [Moniliophthora roreri]